MFGRDALLPRIFDRGTLMVGDVERDFLIACGIEGLEPDGTPRNPALRTEVQEFVRRFSVPRRHWHSRAPGGGGRGLIGGRKWSGVGVL